MEEDQPETTFTIKRGSFMYTMVPLWNTFKAFIHDFLEEYLNDWISYGLIKNHIRSLHTMFE